MPPRRPQSKQKLPSKQGIQKKPPVVEDDTEAEEKFKVELQWCVQQIEAAMRKASLKEKEDMAKAHRTLTSSKAAHIKKRQVMNAMFGDYRAKMKEEESKIKIEMPKMKQRGAVPDKSVFLRKSAEHITTTAAEPLADRKSKTAEGADPIVPGGGSSSMLDNKELHENSGEGANFSRGAEDSVGKSEKIANSFKFPTHSGSTFKFNFSL